MQIAASVCDHWKLTPIETDELGTYGVNVHSIEASNDKTQRAAAESTVRSVKHPFRNGKMPVRAKPRVSMVIIGSALMTNVRRIHRYLMEEREREEKRDEQKERSALK